MSRALAVTAAVLLATTPAGPAAADDGVIRQTMTFTQSDTTLYVSTSFTRLFDARAYERLENGLAATVVIRMWVYPEGKAKALGFVLLHRRCIYDLWGEFYTCVLAGPSGRQTFKVKFKAAALNLMAAIDQVPIADLTQGPVVVAAIAELNPVSKETMAEVRRWLSQGSGGGLDRGGSFFGSFVSVFVNLKIPEADRVLRVRSQPYTSR